MNRKSVVLSALATFLSAGVVLAATASANPYPTQCPAQGGYRITITSGPNAPLKPLDCSLANSIAAKFVKSGPMHQQVTPLTACDATGADTGLLFTCVGEGQFFVYRA